MKMYQSNRPLAGLSCIMKDGRWILFATEGNRPLAGLSCIDWFKRKEDDRCL